MTFNHMVLIVAVMVLLFALIIQFIIVFYWYAHLNIHKRRLEAETNPVRIPIIQKTVRFYETEIQSDRRLMIGLCVISCIIFFLSTRV